MPNRFKPLIVFACLFLCGEAAYRFSGGNPAVAIVGVVISVLVGMWMGRQENWWN